jgi:hypothetical protein
MGGNINLEMFEETVEAIYRANQSKAKSNDDEEEKKSTLLHSMTARRRRRTTSGRRRATKTMTKKNSSIVEEKGTHQTSVGCWTRISPSDQNGLIWKSIVARKKKKCPMQQSVIQEGDLSYY